MAQQFQIETTQNVDLGYEAASLGDRILAFFGAQGFALQNVNYGTKE